MALPPTKVIKREGCHQLKELLQKYEANTPQVEIEPKEDLATLPYTGGTTGLPKGAMMTHYNLISNALQFRSFYTDFEDGKELQIGLMPFYHAGGQLFSIITGILHGDTIVILTTPDIDVILADIVKYKPTIFVGAPTMYEYLRKYKKTSRVNWHQFKKIISGADALNEYTAKAWQERTGTTIHEMYGMTETSCMSHGNPEGGCKLTSIGVPLPNTASVVLDPERDSICPVGEIGEIAVHGPQVTKGYWKNEEATNECRVILDGVEWWRTGDLGRMDDDGYFFVYDRKRDLIKYKGLRIYAREVEEVLVSHPQIKQAGVIPVKDMEVGENVKAMIVLESEARGNLSESDIIEYCEGKLAHYKIPKIVEFIGEIPKTDIGKVSRRELREHEEG